MQNDIRKCEVFAIEAMPDRRGHASRKQSTSDKQRTEEFVALLAQSRSELYRLIFSIVPHHIEAEELFQQTSITLWQKFAEFQSGTDFLRWAASVARFKVRDYWKQRRRDRLRFWNDELVECLARECPKQTDVLQQQRQALAECVNKLPQRDRELLKLRYDTGTTTCALAERLGRPLATLYKALARIRRSLYECVSRSLAEQLRE